jgi:hypothetical protein
MTNPVTVGAFAIVPSNNLAAAQPFWERLGLKRTGGDANYIIMTGWGCEVHVTQAGSGPWRVPEEHNPFGVFIRTPDVDAIAARVDDLIIRPGGVLRHREWACMRWGFADRTACWSALVGLPTSCRTWRQPACRTAECTRLSLPGHTKSA